jgi:hypothetical protein
MKAVTVCIILIAGLTPSVLGQEATPEDFAKFCADIQGRWVGDVTWVIDWPGLGNKGEKVTAYWEGRTSLEGNLLLGKYHGGTGTDTGMTFFDPARKRIRAVSVNSGGTIMESIVYLQEGKWIQETEVTLPDGVKGRLKSIGTITDGGSTWTWEVNGKVGEDVVEDQKDVWRRVAK